VRQFEIRNIKIIIIIASWRRLRGLDKIRPIWYTRSIIKPGKSKPHTISLIKQKFHLASVGFFLSSQDNRNIFLIVPPSTVPLIINVTADWLPYRKIETKWNHRPWTIIGDMEKLDKRITRNWKSEEEECVIEVFQNKLGARFDYSWYDLRKMG